MHDRQEHDFTQGLREAVAKEGWQSVMILSDPHVLLVEGEDATYRVTIERVEGN